MGHLIKTVELGFKQHLDLEEVCFPNGNSFYQVIRWIGEFAHIKGTFYDLDMATEKFDLIAR